MSNAFGTAPVKIGHATVGASGGSGSKNIQAGTIHELTFNGQQTITIPAGGQVVSDGTNYVVTAGQNLSVNLYLPDSIVAPSINYISQVLSYSSTIGDHTEETAGTAFTGVSFSYYLFDGIEVSGSGATGAIVAIGDSITEGFGSSLNANRRWTDFLATRLQTKPSVFGVVNEGIGGNRLLLDGASPESAESRGSIATGFPRRA